MCHRIEDAIIIVALTQMKNVHFSKDFLTKSRFLISYGTRNQIIIIETIRQVVAVSKMRIAGKMRKMTNFPDEIGNII